MPTGWVWHCDAGDPGELSHPSRKLMNAMSPMGTDCGTPRSCQVVPRSFERNRRVPPTSAHTTSPEGALRFADVGRVIGVPVGVATAEGAWLAVGVAVVVGAALAVTAGDALGEAAGPQAARHDASTSEASRFIPQ